MKPGVAGVELLRKIFSLLKTEIEKFRSFFGGKMVEMVDFMGFYGKYKWFPMGTKWKILVDTNQKHLIKCRLKRRLVNHNRRLCSWWLISK